MHFLGKEGIVSFGDNKVLIDGTKGQVFADSIGANNVTTQTLTAGNGNFSVDELGNVTATVADTNNSFSLTENGVSMKADNTTLDVTSGGVAIGNGADFTYIN
ncbi:hypothetical protein, partial [Megasphaera stantonii]|uniref:hypothetical protein n=1 Tax=Megasphaera stantonii TaxID=2144175 RepID=UPI001957C4DC